MRQALKGVGEAWQSTSYLNHDRASQNFRHFANMLNASVYGKAFKRFGNRLRVIPVIEGGNGKRLHYHVIIDCPRDDLRGNFTTMIQEAWKRTAWADQQTYILADADDGWKTYISKTRDKPVFADAIDWLNYHNPD
jgi:hypothetical protein